MRINGVALTDGERGIYGKADTRARLAYLKKHGSPATVNVDGQHATAAAVRANAAAWKLEHGAAYEAAGARAGTAAVKKLHTARAVAGYAPAAERLEVLGLAGRTPRKRAATAPAVAVTAPVTVAPETAADAAPVSWADMPRDERVAMAAAVHLEPVTVPAPMPAQIRAARRASNRELAAAMRAAGLEPRGDAWRMARDGVPLEDIRRELEPTAGGAA